MIKRVVVFLVSAVMTLAMIPGVCMSFLLTFCLRFCSGFVLWLCGRLRCSFVVGFVADYRLPYSLRNDSPSQTQPTPPG